MATAKKNYLTKERHNEIVSELEKMKSSGRRDVAERLKQAKELGDLSENSEYQEARDDQARLEGKIAELEDLLRNSEIIEKAPSGGAVVRIGNRVKVKKGGEEKTFSIVGSNEARPADGIISNESPLGHALLGKKPGEIAEVQTPSGARIQYEIIAIE